MSVKIIHYTNKIYSDGTSPIIIQIIKDKKVRRKVIYSVLPSQWNDKDKEVIPKKHPNYGQINVNIRNEKNRVEDLLLSDPDIDKIFSKEIIGVKNQLNFRQISDLYLKGLIAKSGWTFITFSSIVNKFLDCVGEDIIMGEITERDIQAWISAMQAKGNKEVTIANNVKVIRFVSEFAVRNKYDVKPDALHNLKVPAGPKSFKTKLSDAELKALKEVHLTPGTKLAEIRDMFLLALYLRGIRISDVITLKQKYIVDNRVTYQSEKTGKVFDIKLRPDANELINKYRDDREYLFSFFKFKFNPSKTPDQNEIDRVRHLKSITANINSKLRDIGVKAGIKTKISTHIARHTFARMALDKIKDSNITMDLLGHSSMKVHEAYIREISLTSELDDAADEIFK